MAMSNYFKYFPTMEYDIKNDGNLVRVKDLFRQVRVFDDADDGVTGYEFLHIDNGERPDTLASRVYGDGTLYWLFWLVNDNLTTHADWPRSDSVQEKYISRKYTGKALVAEYPTSIVSSATSKFTMGEKIIGGTSGASGYAINVDPTFNHVIINDVSGIFQVGETVTGSKSNKSFTLHALADYKDRPHHYIDANNNKTTEYNSTYAIVSNAEYERTLNNDKRFIKYIPSKFSHRIVKEFREVIRT